MNVVVADRCANERNALNAVLSDLAGIRLLRGVDSVSGAIDAVTRHAPEMLVTGIELADGDALELVSLARALAPDLRIVVIARDPSREQWDRFLEAGADRFVEHDAHLVELRDVIAALSEPPLRPSSDDTMRLLGRLAAGVVHDLATYHHVISIALQLVERTAGPSEPLSRAKRATEQACALTGSLLGYVRGEDRELAEIDFPALVRSTVDVVSPGLPRTITMMIDLGRDIPVIRGVRSELQQLVLNLVVNAADAMPGGGDLVLRVRPAGPGVKLEVSDTGHGLTETPQPKANGLSYSTKRGRMTGIGLGIIERVIDRHAGQFKLAPRTDRTGTIATVILPAIPPR